MYRLTYADDVKRARQRAVSGLVSHCLRSYFVMPEGEVLLLLLKFLSLCKFLLCSVAPRLRYSLPFYVAMYIDRFASPSLLSVSLSWSARAKAFPHFPAHSRPPVCFCAHFISRNCLSLHNGYAAAAACVGAVSVTSLALPLPLSPAPSSSSFSPLLFLSFLPVCF